MVEKTGPFQLWCDIYIEYSRGYTIEENTFIDKNPVCPYCYGNIGMYISNSGRDPNEIYRNDFKNLAYGIVAYGQNRNETGEGLCLKCNNFESCNNDIHVIPGKDDEGRWLKGRPQGIASSQGTTGSDTSPAGNTFTDKLKYPQTFNYFNHADCNPIDYYHHLSHPPSLIIEPDPYSTNMINKIPVQADYQDKEHACPPNFRGSGINPILEKCFLVSEYEHVINLSDSIQTLKDGGDTYGLNFDVNTSTMDEAYEVRQQLLDESPYLSDTVMKSAIDKENVLNNAMIRDVLVANPQAAKSSEILHKVSERVDPMPEEMMYEILEGRTYKGNLEILEDHLAEHTTAKFKSLHKLESLYKCDTLDYQGSLDSLVNMWEAVIDPATIYKLTLLHLFRGDSSNCVNTLNSVPQLNNLSSEESQEFEQYSELVNLLWPLSNGTINLDSLVENQLFTLGQSKSTPGVSARNILVANGLSDYIEPIYLSDDLKSSMVVPEKPKNSAEKNYRLKIYPNPAKEYIIVSYDLSDLEGDFRLKISSNEGKPVYQQDITGVKNQIIISIQMFPSAQYYLQLVNENYIIESTNFIIVK